MQGQPRWLGVLAYSLTIFLILGDVHVLLLSQIAYVLMNYLLFTVLMFIMGQKLLNSLRLALFSLLCALLIPKEGAGIG